MNLAQRIQTLRKQKGLSQENLAHELGVSRQAVSKWESEQAYPDLDKIILLSDYFHVSTDYLLKGTPAVDTAPGIHKEIPPILDYIAAFLFVIGLLAGGLILAYCTTSMRYDKAFLCLIPVVLCDSAGVLLHSIQLTLYPVEKRKQMNRKFWLYQIWIVGFLPSLVLSDVLPMFYRLPTVLQFILYALPFLNVGIYFILFFKKDSSSH